MTTTTIAGKRLMLLMCLALSTVGYGYGGATGDIQATPTAGNGNSVPGPAGQPGMDGKNGTSVLSGHGQPSAVVGDANYFYIDLDDPNYVICGPKSAQQVWPLPPTRLLGAQGIRGPPGLDSTVPGPMGPQGAPGRDGNSIVGPQGPMGVSGRDGNSIVGPPGPAGADGNSIVGPPGPAGSPGVAGRDGNSIVGPAGPAGRDGNSIVGPAGPQGVMGVAGRDGNSIVGPQGAPGRDGNSIVGPQGPMGVAGVNGNTIYNGTGAPSNALGNANDFYVDTSNATYYVFYGPKSTSAWPTKTITFGSGAAVTYAVDLLVASPDSNNLILAPTAGAVTTSTPTITTIGTYSAADNINTYFNWNFASYNKANGNTTNPAFKLSFNAANASAAPILRFDGVFTPLNYFNLNTNTAVWTFNNSVYTPLLGVGQPATPASTVGVFGNLGVGSVVAAGTAAPANGLLVQGPTLLQSSLGVTGATSVSNLAVNSNATFQGPVAFQGSVTGLPASSVSYPLVAPAGSAAAPSYAVGNPNSGMSYDTTNAGVALSALGNEMLIVRGAQVGIGGYTPASTLGVYGNLAIGTGVAGTTAAPTNGLLVQGPTNLQGALTANSNATFVGAVAFQGNVTGLPAPSVTYPLRGPDGSIGSPTYGFTNNTGINHYNSAPIEGMQFVKPAYNYGDFSYYDGGGDGYTTVRLGSRPGTASEVASGSYGTPIGNVSMCGSSIYLNRQGGAWLHTTNACDNTGWAPLATTGRQVITGGGNTATPATCGALYVMTTSATLTLPVCSAANNTIGCTYTMANSAVINFQLVSQGSDVMYYGGNTTVTGAPTNKASSTSYQYLGAKVGARIAATCVASNVYSLTDIVGTWND